MPPNELCLVLPSNDLLTALERWALPPISEVRIHNLEDLRRYTSRSAGEYSRPLILGEWRRETIPILLHARYEPALDPVILALCGSNGSDLIAASALGADEVINWIENPLLLEARLLAYFRRLRSNNRSAHYDENVNPVTVDPAEEELNKCRELKLDLGEYNASVGGEDLRLTALEFELLAFLISCKGECQSAEVLLRQIWSIEIDVETNRVEVAVSGLRRKLASMGLPSLIKTIRGRSYLVSKETNVRIVSDS